MNSSRSLRWLALGGLAAGFTIAACGGDGGDTYVAGMSGGSAGAAGATQGGSKGGNTAGSDSSGGEGGSADGAGGTRSSGGTRGGTAGEAAGGTGGGDAGTAGSAGTPTGGSGGNNAGSAGNNAGSAGSPGGAGGSAGNPGLTPCTGVCDDYTLFNFFNDYHSGPVGAGARCLETTTLLADGGCYDLAEPRTLSINGVVQSCSDFSPTLPNPVRGGYCIQISAGGAEYANFVVWGGGSAGGGLSPCEGVCDATPFDAPYTSPKLGTGASCFETKTALAGGICNNFIDPARTLQVNGVGECDLATWSIPAPIRGGYCLQVSAGEPDYADFTLW